MAASSGMFLKNFPEISQNFPKTYPFLESFSILSLSKVAKFLKTFSFLKTCSHFSKVSPKTFSKVVIVLPAGGILEQE